MRAYVLIEADPGKTSAVAEAVSLLEDIEDVSVLAGPFDVVVEIEAASHEEIERRVDEIKPLTGVHWLETCSVLDLSERPLATSSTAR
jgi:nitrate reductase NapAB chaperone NapD